MNTLTKYPNSILSKIVTGVIPSGRDKNGWLKFRFAFKNIELNKLFLKDILFIDRNGLIFEFILQFLRTNKLDLHCLSREKLSSIRDEAIFFNITPLILYLENKF